MNHINFEHLYRAGRIRRYHTADSKEVQTVAAHSWGVAMIVATIAPGHPRLADLLKAALTHDLAESETGDVPAPAKWRNKDLNEVLEDIEQDFNKYHGIHFDFSEPEEHILKWADMFEGALWSQHEIRMGNQYMVAIYKRYLQWLRDRIPPGVAAVKLFQQHFGENHASK